MSDENTKAPETKTYQVIAKGYRNRRLYEPGQTITVPATEKKASWWSELATPLAPIPPKR